jgi:5'-nucleotidase
LARLVVERPLPEGAMVNVNVPNLPAAELKGVAFTRQSSRRYLSRLERRVDPRGRPYYWLTGEPSPTGGEEGTDEWALASGFISVTPIHLNLTDERLLLDLSTWGLGVT